MSQILIFGDKYTYSVVQQIQQHLLSNGYSCALFDKRESLNADVIIVLLSHQSASNPEFKQQYNLIKSSDAELIHLNIDIQQGLHAQNVINFYQNPEQALDYLTLLLKQNNHPTKQLPLIMAGFVISVLLSIGMLLFSQYGIRSPELTLADLPTSVVQPEQIVEQERQETPQPELTLEVSTESEIQNNLQQTDTVTTLVANPVSGTAPLAVTYNLNYVDEEANYEWDFDGDGIVDSTENSEAVTYIYDSFGVYNASLIITNADGESQRLSQTIIVQRSFRNPASTNNLIAEFDASPQVGTAPLNVTFTNTSLGEIAHYEWDLDGDSTVDSTSENPDDFLYENPDEYEVSLTIYDENDNSNTVTITIVVEDDNDKTTSDTDFDETSGANAEDNFSSVTSNRVINGNTEVVFSASPASGSAPLTVSFSNESTGNIQLYRWDFDSDGVIEDTNQTPPSYTFDEVGIYQVTHTVLDTDGNVVSANLTIQVLGDTPRTSTGAALTATFSAQPTRGSLPLAVSFNSVSTGDIVSYAWDLDGDGNVDSVASNPGTYIYNDIGTYEVALTVTDINGKTSTDSTTILVEPLGLNSSREIFTEFEVDNLSGLAPLNVQFTNISQGSITGFQWDFDGDGIVDSNAIGSNSYTYNIPGIYPVSLTARGVDGREDTFTTEIHVYDPNEELYADFFVRPSAGQAPLVVEFLNFAYGEIESYEWDFDGDGLVDSMLPHPPPYTYTVAGEYPSTLTVYAPSGQSVQSTIIIKVSGLVDANFTANVQTGTSPLTVIFTNTSTSSGVTYSWDFDGDGLTDSTLQNPPPFVYQQAGTYNALLTVTDASGININTHSLQIIVIEATPEVTIEPTVETSTPEITESPTEVTPELTETPTEVTPEVTESPTELTPELTESPTELTPEATIEPTVETPTPEITESPTELTPEATIEPTVETPTPEITESPTELTPTPEITVEVTSSPEITQEPEN